MSFHVEIYLIITLFMKLLKNLKRVLRLYVLVIIYCFIRLHLLVCVHIQHCHDSQGQNCFIFRHWLMMFGVEMYNYKKTCWILASPSYYQYLLSQNTCFWTCINNEQNFCILLYRCCWYLLHWCNTPRRIAMTKPFICCTYTICYKCIAAVYQKKLVC